MPQSITMSGGGSGVSAAAVAQGINQAADVDALLGKLDLIFNAIVSLTLQAATPIPQLLPAVTGLNAPIETPTIAGIPGKSLIIRFSGWYDGAPIAGLIELVGTDGLVYFVSPLIAAKVGVVSTTKLPVGLGFKIRLSAGGQRISGFINYATAIEVAPV